MLFAITTFVTFFTVIDPIGLLPVVTALLSHFPEHQRKIIVTKAVLISALIITFFAVAGQILLSRLGINLYAFNIAGGVLLFLIALDMLFGRTTGAKETKEEEDEALKSHDVSVFPLAIPLIAGPGTLVTTILYASLAFPDVQKLSYVFLAISLTLLICWLVMMFSGRIVKYIGRTGILVLSRILGILLAALAVQFILNGVVDFSKMYGFIP